MGAFDPTKTKLLKDFKHNSALIGARFDPTGKYVFVSAQDNSLQRWDLASGAKTTFAGHTSWVRALAFSRDSKTFFSADWTGKVLVWNTSDEKPVAVQTIQAHTGWARALAVSPDGKLLASVGNDGKAALWSVANRKQVKCWDAHECHVYNVGFHPDGKSLFTADLKGVVKQWDLTTYASTRNLDAAVLYKYDPTFKADIGGVRSMAISADGGLLACAGITNVSNAFAGIGNPLVVLFDLKTGQRKQLLKPKAAFQGTMWGVAFHAAGYILATAGGNGGQLYFWQADKAESVHMVALPNNARDLDIDADGKRLAIPFFDGAVRLYELSA